MHLISKILSFTIVILLFLSDPVYSRGPWKTNEENTTSNNGIWNNSRQNLDTQPSSSSNTNRAPGPLPEPPGQTDVSPIGEGLAILCFISCGYFIIKKRNSKQLV